MQEAIIMTQIIPTKDLKNTSEISEMCHTTDEPIYITKNGYRDLVIMSQETYDRKMGILRIYQFLHDSDKQIEHGEGLDARDELIS